ncbi:unnamed protein product, partial [Prorocentrum cordatum]
WTGTRCSGPLPRLRQSLRPRTAARCASSASSSRGSTVTWTPWCGSWVSRSTRSQALGPGRLSVTRMDKPVDLKVWVTAFGRITDIPVEEVESTFRVLDPDGAGLVPASRLQEVGALATASDAEEESSPTRRAWRLRSSQTRLPHWKAYHSGGLGLQPLTAPGDALRANPHLRAINLWGNRLCNRGAAALAAALEANFGLQYLGLGRNLITHEGLERLCQSVGYIQVDSDKQAANVQKAIKDTPTPRSLGTRRAKPS